MTMNETHVGVANDWTNDTVNIDVDGLEGMDVQHVNFDLSPRRARKLAIALLEAADAAEENAK